MTASRTRRQRPTVANPTSATTTSTAAATPAIYARTSPSRSTSTATATASATHAIRARTPRRSLALWDGFYDANDIAGWTTAGTWTVSAGKLSGGATNQGLLYAYPPTQFQHAFAQTSVHVNTLATPTSNVSPAALF